VTSAYDVASRVTDPELPMLTLADLGVLRAVEEGAEEVVVTLTPTYSGCPALATMRDDVVRLLTEAGFAVVRVRLELDPPWTTDSITPAGRRALAEHGISPPGPAARHGGPVPLTLAPPGRAVVCPHCSAADTALTSEFGPTPCTALYRCLTCGEPFEHVKEM
jgi:ring-1,2-phenylacetyl-CoA epoxidase subunit PaaD